MLTWKNRVLVLVGATVVACGNAPPGSDTGSDGTVRDVTTVFDSELSDAGLDSALLDTGTADQSSTEDAAVVRDTGPDVFAYPDGPYGNRLGDTIKNLDWEGYLNTAGQVVSTQLPYGQTSLQAMRGSRRGYALIHVAEAYCPGCRNAARELATLGPMVLAAGGVVVEIFASDSGTTATKAQMDSWIDFYGLKVTTVRDLEGTSLVSLMEYGIRESAFVVDLRTMRIVRKVSGSTSGVGTSSVGQLVPEIITLLDAQRDQ